MPVIPTSTRTMSHTTGEVNARLEKALSKARRVVDDIDNKKGPTEDAVAYFATLMVSGPRKFFRPRH